MTWRRAAAWLPGVAALAAAAWLLAPAISANPYLPAARDFEQALRGVERTAGVARTAHDDHHGAVTHRSPVIEAPARFDAVGLAEELRPLELRAREDGGEWSDWLEIANGDPAWFGGADDLQLRARGYRPRGPLHYVNVSGDSTPAEALLNDARRAVNGAAVAFTGLFATDDADALPPKPEIVRRGEWGANARSGGCRPRTRPDYGRVKAAVFHHTVGWNNYSESDAPGVVLAICRYHRNALDWSDIGYNALVDRFGNVYAGRAGGLGQAVVGAHAQGVNAQTTGVALMGTHTKKEITKDARLGLTEWLAWKLQKHGRTTYGRARMRSLGGETARYPAGRRFRMRRIVGHRRTNLTECPGDGLNRIRAEISAAVQARIDKYAVEDDSGGIG